MLLAAQPAVLGFPGPVLPAWQPGAERLAALAVTALVAEAELTPKPGLVDARGSGVHRDLDLPLMRRSAITLRPTFRALAVAAAGRRPGPALREQLARIGRRGERAMLAATGGANTHRGAIWALGLLVAAAAIAGADAGAEALCAAAGAVARYPDRFAPPMATNGTQACARHGVGGARRQAEAGFPQVVQVALPTLRAARARGAPETVARLDALLAVMAALDDTCLLHRGGQAALEAAQEGAAAVLALGGTGTPAGRAALAALERALVARNASPGGSADLLAAALFLDGLGRTDAEPARPALSHPAWES
jgi:triphosphoribosyl-dephospho-CoA synthase